MVLLQAWLALVFLCQKALEMMVIPPIVTEKQTDNGEDALVDPDDSPLSEDSTDDNLGKSSVPAMDILPGQWCYFVSICLK